MRQRIPFRRTGFEEADALLARPDLLVLDVRDARSFAAAHMAGALHVSHANVSAVIADTPKSRAILVYCYHGNASQEYAQIFSDFGFTEVYSLDGGYEAWRTRPQPDTAIPALDPLIAGWLDRHGFPAGDISGVVGNRTTPLMKAAHLGAGDMVRLLAGAGAPLDARNADGNTALWLACVGRHLDVIDLLVELGADLDNQNDNGATALMYAASAGLDGVVARLLARGADASLETLDGFTALDLAGTVECLTLLRRVARAAAQRAAGD